MPDRPPELLADFMRRQTLAWLVPLALATIALSSLAIYGVHQRQSAEVNAMAQGIGGDIAADIQRRQHGLKAVIAAVTLDGPNPQPQTWYRHARAYDQTFDAAVILVDALRRIVFNTRRSLDQPLAMLPSPPGRSAFSEALASGEPQMGDVVQAPVLQTLVVSVIVPADSQRGLLGLIPLKGLEASLRRQQLPEGWVATVFDSVGNTIASTADAPLAFAGDRSAQRAYAAVAGTRWSVVVEVRNWPFYRPHLQVASALLVGICLAFAGAALASRHSSLELVRAVGRLADKLPQPVPRAAKATKRQPMLRIVELEAVRSELQRLGNAQHQAEEAERSRIARELHDGIQQDVAAIQINLSVALSRFGGDTQTQEPLNAALTSAQRVLKGIQHAVNELRPPSFESGGLMVALEDLAQQFNAITGTQVELEVVGSASQVDALPLPIADCLYRIAQECLNNVRKHAQASFVHVELDLLDEAEVCLRVADDGVGLGSTGRLKLTGFGTQSMVERANALNGALAVWQGSAEEGSEGGRGTTVRVTLPL